MQKAHPRNRSACRIKQGPAVLDLPSTSLAAAHGEHHDDRLTSDIAEGERELASTLTSRRNEDVRRYERDLQGIGRRSRLVLSRRRYDRQCPAQHEDESE